MIKQKVEGKREREYGGLWAKARQKQHERQIRPVGPSPMVALTSLQAPVIQHVSQLPKPWQCQFREGK